MNAQPNIIDNVRNGLIVCMIGQFNKAQAAQLAMAARVGLIHKAKAPFAGRFGAIKTYYAASQVAFDRYQSEQVAKFNICQSMDDFNREVAA